MVATRSIRWFLSLAAILLAAGILHRVDPATLVVDDDGGAPYVSIQVAIDAAVPGEDDVLVECGSYYENIVMRDGVSVRGRDARCAIINPTDDDNPVVDMPALGADTVFEGFTVKNLYKPRPAIPGIRITDGSPVITRNIIQGAGDSTYSNTGIGASGGAPVISYNVITGNYDCCWGGGVGVYSGDAQVRSNLVVGNLSYYGAGMFIMGGNPEITNNTIVNNAGWVGGGILTYGYGLFANNVIADNTAVIYGGGVTIWGGGSGPFESNNVYGNEPDNYSSGDLTGIDGNISVDPGFVDRNVSFNGFSLRSSSPLVDAASPGQVCNLDLRGIARPVDGNADNFARCDIGARENGGLTGLVHTEIEFVWDPGRHDPPDYNIYRGDLATLRETGVYTQDPISVDGAWHFCDYSNALSDSDVPEAGDCWFYIPVAWGVAEGTLGFDSSLTERPKHLFCQGP